MASRLPPYDYNRLRSTLQTWWLPIGHSSNITAANLLDLWGQAREIDPEEWGVHDEASLAKMLKRMTNLVAWTKRNLEQDEAYKREGKASERLKQQLRTLEQSVWPPAPSPSMQVDVQDTNIPSPQQPPKTPGFPVIDHAPNKASPGSVQPPGAVPTAETPASTCSTRQAPARLFTSSTVPGRRLPGPDPGTTLPIPEIADHLCTCLDLLAVGDIKMGYRWLKEVSLFVQDFLELQEDTK